MFRPPNTKTARQNAAQRAHYTIGDHHGDISLLQASTQNVAKYARVAASARGDNSNGPLCHLLDRDPVGGGRRPGRRRGEIFARRYESHGKRRPDGAALIA